MRSPWTAERRANSESTNLRWEQAECQAVALARRSHIWRTALLTLQGLLRTLCGHRGSC